MKVKIWDALNDEEADAKEIELRHPAHFYRDDHTLTRLVQDFVERRWGANDYLETTEVNVKSDSGVVLEFTVKAEETVVFRAMPRDKR